MSIVRHKVFAYITSGTRLLVLRHPHLPAAGIQIPAGTVEAGERPEDAVMREAYEETGLRDLTLVDHLGDQVRDMFDVGREEIHHRHFYHLRCPGAPSERWQHTECYASDEPAGRPIVFEFSWAALPHAVPTLVADHGALLPALCQRLFSV